MIKFKHIRTRIAVIFLSLVVILQVAGLIPLKFTLNQHANKIAEEQINVGERVFVNLLQHNTQSLRQAAQVLAADYAFREAVASVDVETIESALANYQGRIHAQVAYYFSSDGALSVTTATSQNSQHPEDLKQAMYEYRTGTLKFDIVDGKPYQLITVPVKAPDVIGWIVLGFSVDSNLASQIKQLTHLDVTFLQKVKGQQWQLVSTTASVEAANMLTKTVADIYRQPLSLHSMELDGQEYELKIRSLHETPDKTLLVILQGSVTTFVQDLNDLFSSMLMLTLIGIVILVVVVWHMSRRITQPIAELVDSADQMAHGNYEKEIVIQSSDEVGSLAKALNNMREAILLRTRRIQKLAFNDELTGVSNRLAFMQALNQAILSHAGDKQSLSVLVFNIDRFKPINNTLGRVFGDDLLRYVAHVLKQHLYAKEDVVARLDADEFAVILHGADQAKATRFAETISRVFEQPAIVQMQEIDVRVGIGIALYPQHGDNEEHLLHHAETAKQESKVKKAGWIVYNAALEIDQSETLNMISALKEAIVQDQLLLYVQPKVDIASRKVLGGEALIRWVHPEKGMVFPDQFVPFAEQTGVISDITQLMLRKACGVLADYQQQGLHMSLAVNLSARDLNNMALPEQVATMLQAYGLKPELLKLEITEGSLMQDPERAELVLRKLSAMGISLAIDDFGTGYSSLGYLRQLPVHELKIDKSFVMFMDKNPGDYAIVKSTIDLGHNLGLKVVAEGIESETVFGQLAKLGCDEGQGYFIGKPMPERDFSIWLERWEGQHLIDIDVGDGLQFTSNPLEPDVGEQDPFSLSS